MSTIFNKIFLSVLFLGFFLFGASFSVVPQIYAALPGARSATVAGDVFLGGDYIELGISQYGSFGTSQNKPAEFFGTGTRNTVGMSSDLDGFNTGTDWRMDFFMPGTPEERWSVGYTVGGSPVTASNARAAGTTGIADTITTNESTGTVLKATSIGTLNSNLRISQTFSFNSADKFFKTVVLLENVSDSTTLDSVRFMRSFDPDNTVDKGGSYTTRNTIVNTHLAGDGKAVVQADTSNTDSDPVYTGTGGASGGTRSPIFFYSSDDRARVNYHTGLNPGTVYTASVYNSVNAKGAAQNQDGAISIAFDVGTLTPGQTATITYYTSLDERDFSEVEQEIQDDEAQGAPAPSIPTNETTDTSVTVQWTTDIASSSLIEYGLVPTYGFTTPETNTDPRVTEHEVTISGLKACARYFYRTKSTNSDTLASYSEQSTFTTAGCAVSSIVEGTETNIPLDGGSLDFNLSSVSAQLVIPENFSDRPASFQINRLDATPSTPTGKQLLPNRIFDLLAVDADDTQITSFNTPVTFVVGYADVDLTEIDESTLDLYKYSVNTWIPQNCVQDTTAKTLTCTLPSFSVYGVFGSGFSVETNNSTATSQSSSAGTSECSKDHVMSAPDLFQVTTGSTTATLFFTPLSQTNQFYVSYATNPQAEEHGTLVSLSTEGVQSFTIESLKPHTQYFFKVRGNKDCSTGPWSSIQSGKTGSLILLQSQNALTQQEQKPEKSKETTEPENTSEANELSEATESGLYDVYVVVNSGGEKVAGAVIEFPELHATAVTNEDGEAVFKNVKKGSHLFKLINQAYAAEHVVAVEGDEREFNVSITLEVQENFLSSNWNWLLLVLFLILIIIFLLRSRFQRK